MDPRLVMTYVCLPRMEYRWRVSQAEEVGSRDGEKCVSRGSGEATRIAQWSRGDGEVDVTNVHQGMRWMPRKPKLTTMAPETRSYFRRVTRSMTARVEAERKRGGTGATGAEGPPKKRRSSRVFRAARAGIARAPAPEEEKEEDVVPEFGRCCVCDERGWYAMRCLECGSETGAVCVCPDE